MNQNTVRTTSRPGRRWFRIISFAGVGSLLALVHIAGEPIWLLLSRQVLGMVMLVAALYGFVDRENPGQTSARTGTTMGQSHCAECNGLFNVPDMVAHNDVYVCARCKPIFLQKLAEGVKMQSSPAGGLKGFKLTPLRLWVLVVIAALAGALVALFLPSVMP